MRFLILAVCAVLGTSGCGSSTWTAAPVVPVAHASPPSAVRISGVVRYPGGHPVNTAWVHVGQVGGTLSDTAGVYVLDLPTAGDTLTVEAKDGFAPGMMYGWKNWGSVQVVVNRHDVVANIVLDHHFP